MWKSKDFTIWCPKRGTPFRLSSKWVSKKVNRCRERSLPALLVLLIWSNFLFKFMQILEHKTPWIDQLGATTIRIGFDRNFFTESNGVIQNVSIILTEDYEVNDFSYVSHHYFLLFSLINSLWNYQLGSDVQNYELWPPYQTTESDYNPFINERTTKVNYDIGKAEFLEKFKNPFGISRNWKVP